MLRLAGGVAALLVGTTLPAGAAPAGPVELRGTVTLSGTTSFVREVVLRTPLRFTAQHRVVRTAGGRFSGFVLRRVGDGVTTTVASIAPGYCAARGCARPAWSGTYVTDLFTGFPTNPGEPITYAPLAPGRYQLYLIADGKPVTVTLKFGGTGRTTLTGGAARPTAIDMPKPSQYGPETAAGNTGHLYAAGATHRAVASSTFFYMLSWKLIYGPPKTVNQEGVCVFEGPPVGGPSGAYQYPCAGNQVANFGPFGQWSTGTRTGPLNALEGYAAILEFFGVNEGQEEYSIGGFINGPSPATGAHTVILWADFP